MSGPLFEVHGIDVAAGGRLLYERLRFSVQAGDRIALSGPSGTGKTTLLRTLARLVEPVQGETLLEGRTPEQWGWPAYRRRVIYAAQRPVLGSGTVAACLEAAFRFHTAESPYDEAAARAALSALGLEETTLDAAPETLSEGQAQRVALVRAVLARPRVLLLDEPTSALDADNAVAAEQWMTAQAGALSMALLVVTHDAAQAERWCTRQLELPGFAPREPGHV